MQRGLRCTFIPSPDVPRGRETVGTTPPPRPAPQKECATTPQPPYHQQASLWPATVALGRAPTPAPPAATPGTATGSRPARTAQHTAEHFVQKVTDCTQSDLDSSLSAQNVTLRTKRHPVHKMSLHTTLTHTNRSPGYWPARPRRGRLSPTRPGTPTLTDKTRTTHTSLKSLRPTLQNPYTTRCPTPPTPQTPPPRTSTVLTTNKYRSHEQ